MVRVDGWGFFLLSSPPSFCHHKHQTGAMDASTCVSLLSTLDSRSSSGIFGSSIGSSAHVNIREIPEGSQNWLRE